MSYITTVKFEMICHVNLLSDSANHRIILTAVHSRNVVEPSGIRTAIIRDILMPNNYILLAGMTTPAKSMTTSMSIRVTRQVVHK